MKLFGSSGIRRVVDRDFLSLTFEIGLAMGVLYPSIVVGRDTRTSGEAMKSAFVSGALAAGSSVADAGVTPTPTLAYAARGFAAGAVITASHNPPEYNGIKLFNTDGSSFAASQRGLIEEIVAGKTYGVAAWESMKPVELWPGAVDEHIERILQDALAGSGPRVVVDCGGGAACEVTPTLLRRMGCDVVELNCTPDGHFPRGIEPNESNLQQLAAMVKSEGAQLGIAHDGDADRVAAVDDRGAYVSGDGLLALLARQVGAKRVVTTVDASMLIEELGFEVVRTKVGDVFVSDVLAESDPTERANSFGGEPSGSYIFPEMFLCPDGPYAAATIVAMVPERPLSELVAGLPSYVVRRGSVPASGTIMSAVESCLLERGDGRLDTTDGIRLAYDDGWLLIRASGTEPKVRITAEARNEKRAREIFELGQEVVARSMREQGASIQ